MTKTEVNGFKFEIVNGKVVPLNKANIVNPTKTTSEVVAELENTVDAGRTL